MAENTAQAGVLYWSLDVLDSEIAKLDGKLKTLKNQFQTTFTTGSSGGTRQVTREVSELDNQIRELNERLRIGRNSYVANKLSAEDFKTGLKQLRGEMDSLVASGQLNNTQLARLTTSMATAQRATDTLEGRASKLGLAHQINIALGQRFANTLQSFGPAGAIAANSLEKISLGISGITAQNLTLASSVSLLQALPVSWAIPCEVNSSL